jgi:hypothetical protein
MADLVPEHIFSAFRTYFRLTKAEYWSNRYATAWEAFGNDLEDLLSRLESAKTRYILVESYMRPNWDGTPLAHRFARLRDIKKEIDQINALLLDWSTGIDLLKEESLEYLQELQAEEEARELADRYDDDAGEEVILIPEAHDPFDIWYEQRYPHIFRQIESVLDRYVASLAAPVA